MNIRITVEDILKQNSYGVRSKKRIREHIGDGKTLIDVLNETSVHAADRIWCVTRFLPDEINRRFAADCALHVAHLWNMPPVVREYLETLDENLKEGAVDACRAANAAYNTGRNGYFAYFATAYAVDYSYTPTATLRAADRAANAAARAAERKWQISRLMELVKGDQ